MIGGICCTIHFRNIPTSDTDQLSDAAQMWDDRRTQLSNALKGFMCRIGGNETGARVLFCFFGRHLAFMSSLIV